MRSAVLPQILFSLALVTALLAAPFSFAFQPEPDSQVFEILLPEYGADLAPTHAAAAAAIEVAALELGGQWRVYRWDRAAETPAWIYGSGYQLTARGADDAELEAAARAFIAAQSDILRARNEDLVLADIVRGAGKIGIHFAQTYEGLLVFGGRVRLALGESGKLAAFGSEFHSGIDLDPVPSLSAAAAVSAAQNAVPFNPAVDEVLGTPGLVVVPVPRFEGGAVYRLAWRARVTTQEPMGVWRTYVDAHTGEIFWRENEAKFLYEGTSKGDVENPSWCAGATPDTPFRWMQVTALGAGWAYTDSTGQFSIPANVGTTTASAEFDGAEIDIRNRNGPDASFSGPIVPDTPLDIVWTDQNSDVAERDVFYWVNETHAYIKHLEPGWIYGISSPIVAYTGHVNYPDTCNAVWGGSPLGYHLFFFQAGVTCANLGRFGDVIAHECGHGVQASLLYPMWPDSLGWQGAEGLGEGNGDILGVLMTGDPELARGFDYNCARGPGCPGPRCRNCENTLRYPEDVVGQEIHDAGRVICGFHWDTWHELAGVMGEEPGKGRAAEIWHYSRKLYKPWFQPDQVLAYFLVDDDDENLLNGTPHFDEICVSAENHGFSCPETVPVWIVHTPLEDTQETANPYPVVAEVVALDGLLDPDSLLVNYRLNFGAMQQLLMTPTANPDEYAASIPAQPLGTLVQYYIYAANDLGGHITHPMDAPGILHTFFVGTLNAAVAEDMETDPGWTEGPSTATQGLWERADPFGIIKYVQGVPYQLQPDDDHTLDPGVQCWFTGPAAGFPGNNSVNNGGYTTLQTDVYNLAGEQYVRVTFWLWYSNHLGNVTDDVFDIDVSTDGGSSWVTLEARAENTHENWEKVRFDLLDYVPATSTMKFRFVARDLGDPSLVEAGVDDFLIETVPGVEAVESPAGSAPLRFAVEQNRPNPFNPSTEISYTVPSLTRLTLRIYDGDGRLLRTLVDRVVERGVQTAHWDGRDASGVSVPSGIYYYRVSGDGFEATRKMALVK